jgi:L-ascorbate metabolism protein UlaG (beta-lactamase superfamily)
VIDPFMTKNPKTPAKYKNLKALGKVDLILITHGHADHSLDAPALQKLTGAKVAGIAELVRTMAGVGALPAKSIIAYNKFGTIAPFGPKGPKVHMVTANHSSSWTWKDPKSGKVTTYSGGAAVGYVVELENGFKIYHTGDTGVFSDMAIIGDMFKPDLVLAAIGGHFTMGPDGAAYALTKFLKPKTVIPIHFGTFPILRGSPDQLKAALGANSGINVMVLKPGDEVEF